MYKAVRYGVYLLISCFLLIHFYSLYVLHHPRKLSANLLNTRIHVTGQIIGLPKATNIYSKFYFKTNKGLLLINWYKPYPRLMPGSIWSISVKLKQPISFKNPYTFNYAKWLKQKGVSAIGYVKYSYDNQEISWGFWRDPVNNMRFLLREKLLHTLYGNKYKAIILALAIGDKSLFTQKIWQTFTSTGTSHLVAISGLHIGLVAGLIFFIVRYLWTFIPWLRLYIPAQQVAAYGAPQNLDH